MDDRFDITLRSRLVAVEDVARRVSPELRDALRRFYGELLCLSPVVTLADSTGPDEILRFRSERIELRFAFGAPVAHDEKGHVILEVNALDEVARRFEEHRIAFERFHGLSVTEDRIRAKDPAGHVVIVQQTWPF